MVAHGGLVLPLLVMTISLNLCNALWIDNRDRRMPPPVVSFLDKIRDLGRQQSGGTERQVADGHISTEFNKEIKPRDNSINNMDTHISSRLHPREKRYISTISMRGCHLGTCQIQNLASMIYRLGNNSYKEGSNRDTKDPLGYGRRRRSLLQNKKRTDLPGILLAT
ncbi:uncharacterized protein LOC108696785 [Xenopus laevis]|uniref:Uncharacterized protein LOC108696785 n=2 Tax=Xenopus laevis TaxID=8355 RepID=A0A1L8FNT1_XENLA|nr:uncharacterized protein LOC108696785 [Xenopus laevis]OCT73211.1 hypothetical protein XELAEV_18036190mg [Xenopus laevis]